MKIEIPSDASSRLCYGCKLVEKALHYHLHEKLVFRMPRRQDFEGNLPSGQIHDTPELFYQIGGCTRFHFPGGGYTLNAGEWGLIPPRLPHWEIVSDTDTTFQTLVLAFHWPTPEAIWSVLTKNLPIPALIHVDMFVTTPSEDVIPLLNLIWKYRKIKQADRLQKAALEMFLILIEQAWQSITDEKLIPNPSGKLRRVIEMIRTRQDDPTLKISDLAREVGCTPEYLSFLFKKEIGMTPLNYIRKERLHKSRAMLIGTSLPVSDIAWRCGFGTPSHFIKLFRKQQGLTPTAYRKHAAL